MGGIHERWNEEKSLCDGPVLPHILFIDASMRGIYERRNEE